MMKIVILAGGFGTRISEESQFKPKPMIEIGGKPILWHIMKEYSYYGYNDYQEILDTYGKTMNAEIGYQVLYQKVVEFVCDNVTINDTSSTEQ